MSVTEDVGAARVRAAELLTSARELFRTTHWAQKYFYKHEEKAKFCAVGGIRYYYVGDPLAGLLEVDVVELDQEKFHKVAAEIGQDAAGAAFDPDFDPGLPYEIAVRALADVVHVGDVREYLDDVEDQIYEWNDADGRTLDEVLEAFTAASERAGTVELPW